MSSAFRALVPSLIAKSAHFRNEAEEQRDIFESHRHHVFSIAYYMMADEMEAETILGSTFVQAFKEKPKPTIEELDRALMQELHQRLSLEPVAPVEAGEEGLGNRNVRRTDLEEALWQLPPRERLCFLLRDVEGYASERVAGLLATTEAEIKRTTISARMRIRNLLLEQRAAATA